MMTKDTAPFAATRAVVTLLVVCWLTLSGGAADARPVVSDVQLSGEGQARAVRLVVDAPIDFRVFTLASPLRLVLDLPSVAWRPPPTQLERVARQSAVVAAVRHGKFKGGTERIVFDLKRPLHIVQAALVPYGTKFALTLRWQESNRYAAQRFGDFREVPLPPQRPMRGKAVQRPLIVLDPGHGGVDPGAIGRRGTHEKAITLKMAKQLKDALQATGRFRAALTRHDDRFLPLRERTRLARRLGASLFVSLHADSALNRDARGLSVYTLSDTASDREAAALAKQENQADTVAGLSLTDEEPDVISILIDLAQRETKNRSVRFANQLVQTMVLRVPLLERPHRQAGFAVLKSPDIPAVLVELGFLSNPDEERLLLSRKHRDALTDGIVAAIDNFFVTDLQAAGGQVR